MSRGRHGTPRAFVEPEKAQGLKLCTDCKHCEGRICIRNQVKASDKVMVDIVDGTTHTWRGEVTGSLGCANERRDNSLGKDWRGLMRFDAARCGPDARFFQQKPEVTVNVEEFMKA